jgi:hypothetical protein
MEKMNYNKTSDTSTRATGELINIIKELFYNTSGENTEERDRIIKKVDIQFNECDSRIDKYIRNSSKDLSKLIKLFNEIAKKIEQSRANVSSSREALKQCKVLLQSKRDDVRRLWLDWCEQKFYYNNLAKLKQIYMTSETINHMCTDKKYLEAANLISQYTKELDGEFGEIGALNDFNRNLNLIKIKLEKHLLEELNNQFYDQVIFEKKISFYTKLVISN